MNRVASTRAGRPPSASTERACARLLNHPPHGCWDVFRTLPVRERSAVQSRVEHRQGGTAQLASAMLSVASSIVGRVEVVLRTETPEGIDVVLTAVVYAKILEEHAAVADLDVIRRTIRSPDDRRADVRPGRERFFRRDRGLWVLAVVEFGDVPAIIVTVFSAERPPA